VPASFYSVPDILSYGSRRNWLTPEIFEALRLLKSTYRNGHIQAAAEAASRVGCLANVTDEEVDLTGA
jgi:hypothetical protein